ncbi:MAG: DUF5803 family protein [Halobacteriales archaeon]
MRRDLAVVAVLLALAVSGCLSPGERDYGDDVWNTSADVTYYLEGDSYVGVVALDEGDENRSLRLWQRDPVGGDTAVSVTSPRARRDGEVVNLSTETHDDYTSLEVGGEPGLVAYTGLKRAGEFSVPVPVNGSVEVHLPPDKDARNLFLGRISPGEHEVVSTEPLVVRWDEVERGSHVSVDYYTRGTPWLLLGGLVLLGLVAVAVVYRYRREIERLRSRRAVDLEDELE